jgi:hypothetical protein
MRKLKQSSTPKDENQLAASIVAQTTGQPLPVINPKPEKNPAAVALGRLGGLKGGMVRAQCLTPEKRSAIARNAALKRWASHQDQK